MSGTLAGITAKTAGEVCTRYALGEQAAGLLRKDMTPKQFLDALIEKTLYPEAARFLAHGLPKREAVWWGCQCVRSVQPANPPAPILAALQSAEKWVADPSDANRRAARPAAEAAGANTAAGCVAMAAFWSGGSLGPPDAPPVPPGEYLTATGASGAVMLAAIVTEAEKAAEKYQKFFALGADVANGINKWK